MIRRAVLAIGTSGILAACTSAPMRPVDQSYLIALAPDGLHATENDLRIDFGRAEAGTISAVSKLLLAPPASRHANPECGAGPVTTVSWKQGLDLLFQDGDFRGWAARNGEFTTRTGISPGMTARQIQDSGVRLEDTTLGREFDIGGIFGLIEGPGPDAQVSLIRAGASCFFR